MNDELALGKKLNVHTYPQYAFIDAIMNNKNTNSNRLCNIHIKNNSDEGKVIDYVGFMNRDYVNYAINPLIKFSYDKRETVNKRGLWNYIKESICDKRYLQIWLNEYYIEELEAFKKHDYYHESLIYGYDDRRKVVSIMSFHNGMPKFIKITRRSLENA